jgi:hypothetical protein
MFIEGQPVIIAGKKFEYDVFEYLLNRFKEGFSHASLTIEEAFRELDSYEEKVEVNKSYEACEYFKLLSKSDQNQIMDIVRQIIVFKGYKFGVFKEKLTGEQSQINKIYNKYFSYFDQYVLYYLKFNKDGSFSREETFRNMNDLFINLPQRMSAYDRAYNMQKDNLDAFDYAMNLNKITIPEVIEINKIVTKSDPDRIEGFKKTNNDIFSASFTPTDKTLVPTEMQKLFAEYKNGFGLQLLDFNENGISSIERNKRINNYFRREALFHIKFERIHPFNDGNGRTGRIILNYNLLSQGLAPVLITGVMSDDYKECINNFDVDGLTKLLINSSSQQIVNWVSFIKLGLSIKKKEINPDNSKLAVIDGYSDSYEGTYKRKK